MAIYNDHLYVADIDELVKIKIENRRIVKKYATAEKNPLLNDVAITSNGQVYITASEFMAFIH